MESILSQKLEKLVCNRDDSDHFTVELKWKLVRLSKPPSNPQSFIMNHEIEIYFKVGVTLSKSMVMFKKSICMLVCWWKSPYQDWIHRQDLFTGSKSLLPERNRLEQVRESSVQGSKLGPTSICATVDQFVALKNGDKHWYENADMFSKTQLAGNFQFLRLSKSIFSKHFRLSLISVS